MAGAAGVAGAERARGERARDEQLRALFAIHGDVDAYAVLPYASAEGGRISTPGAEEVRGWG